MYRWLWSDLHEETASKGPDQKNHGEHICEPNFDSLPKLWVEVVIRIRVVKYVDASGAQEAEVDASYNSKLDWAVPVEEHVFEEQPDQVRYQ